MNQKLLKISRTYRKIPIPIVVSIIVLFAIITPLIIGIIFAGIPTTITKAILLWVFALIAILILAAVLLFIAAVLLSIAAAIVAGVNQIKFKVVGFNTYLENKEKQIKKSKLDILR